MDTSKKGADIIRNIMGNRNNPRTFGGSGTCACDTDRKKDRIENGF